MPKPINIASTSHAQHLEMQGMFDATGNVAELRKALQDAIAKNQELQTALDSSNEIQATLHTANTELAEQLANEQAAHAKAQAALEAATATPPQQ
jgi:uncharacterized protein YgiM (DUF1202 family)